MFNKRHILSFATIVVGASATGIFRQFSSNSDASASKSSPIDDSNPCHVTCSREYSPVCATDAETYENICLFKIAKCINKDLQLVANVTCPDFLVNLSQFTQNRMLDGPTSLNSTYGTVGNLTKTAEVLSSTLNSIPIIKIPSLNLPLFGISPVNPNKLLKHQKTKTTVDTTTTTTTTTTTVPTTDTTDDQYSDSLIYTTQESGFDDEGTFTTEYSESNNENENTSTQMSDLEASSKQAQSVSTLTLNSTTDAGSNFSTGSPTASKSSLLDSKLKHITNKQRKLIETTASNKDESGLISNVAKTLQNKLNIGNQESGSNTSGLLGNSGLILSNLDDTKATVQGMIKTIPYMPGKENNVTSVNIVEELSSIIKLPNNTYEGKGLLVNITNDEALSNILDKRENKNMAANFTDFVPSIKNITYTVTETSFIDKNHSETESPLNILSNGGRLNATEVVKSLSTSISNIARSIINQTENQATHD